MTDSTTAEPAAAATSAGPIYLADAPRTTTIILQHPFELDGVQIREVTVRRLRGFEAKQFAQASLAAANRGEHEPMFPGIGLPVEIYALLDDDDVWAIDQVVEDFLPARFQALSALATKLQGLDNSDTGGQSPA